MMTLEVQIQSLIYSLVFGMFISMIFNFFYKYLFNKRKIIKILSTELFIISSVLLYFLLLVKINNGIISYYLFISIILGFVIGNKKTKILRFKKAKATN